MKCDLLTILAKTIPLGRYSHVKRIYYNGKRCIPEEPECFPDENCYPFICPPECSPKCRGCSPSICRPDGRECYPSEGCTPDCNPRCNP